MEAKCTEQSSLGLMAGHDFYEVRPRKDGDGFDLISELFRYGPIWYAGPDAVRNAIAYAKYRPHFRSQRPIIRDLDVSGAWDPDARIERGLRPDQRITDETFSIHF